jgi:hypothetical protein
MPYLKTHRNFIIFFLFVLTTAGPMLPSFAKMQATQMISANAVTRHYKAEMAKGKLPADEAERMKLANIAEEVFEVKEFAVSGYHSTDVEQVKSVYLKNIANSIQQAIQKKTNWDDGLTKSKMITLKNEETLLKKSLGEKSLGWAWYLYQKGSKKEAQLVLSGEFERTYADTMKLTEITGFKDSTPSWEAESIHKALIPLSPETENKSREEKVQKMRLHISNLPNMRMMT